MTRRTPKRSLELAPRAGTPAAALRAKSPRGSGRGHRQRLNAPEVPPEPPTASHMRSPKPKAVRRTHRSKTQRYNASEMPVQAEGVNAKKERLIKCGSDHGRAACGMCRESSLLEGRTYLHDRPLTLPVVPEVVTVRGVKTSGRPKSRHTSAIKPPVA